MIRLAAAAVVLVLGMNIACAQEAAPQKRSSPEEMQKTMQATFSAMVPYMSSMVDAMIQAQLNTISQTETADKMARYVRNLYEALLKQGFSKSEALEIVTRLALPGSTMSMK